MRSSRVTAGRSSCVFCDLRRLHPVRGDQRARGGDGRPPASTTPRWATSSPATRGPWSGSPATALMVFFNDPLPCEDAADRAVGMAVAMRGRDPRPRGELDRPRSRPGVLDRHRPGLRDPGPDRVRGPVRLRRDRQRHQPGRPAVLRGRTVGGATSPSASSRPSAGRAVTDPVGELTLRGFSRPVSVFSVRGLDAAQVSS